MCGILGGNDNKWDYEKGIQSLYHRGPDGQRVKRMEGFTFAFSRLSIMDLSQNGMQPMTSNNGDVTIIFNGEIYGYTLLKRELEKKYRFRSGSDTEVVLNAYIEYGDEFIDKIDGMFAIAIYDKRTMQLKLYRDRSGIKPLYYYVSDGQFAFASELKALIMACKNVNWMIDYTAIYDYLFCQYIPAPKTMYKNCYKLPPAHMLVYDIDNRKILGITKYWKLHVNTAKGRYRKDEVLCDELRSILEHTVKEQLVADVPVGCFLSGGIDSSIVTYEGNKFCPDIYTFTIGFEEKRYDESKKAKVMSEKYNLNSRIKIVDIKDVDAIKDKLREWYDEPFADTSAYPSFVVSKLAKEQVTVILTGDGGDELFGGYNRYRLYAEGMENRWRKYKVTRSLGEWLNVGGFLSDICISRFGNIGFNSYLPLIVLKKREDMETLRKKWGIGADYDPYWHLRKFYKKELPCLTRVRYLDYKTYLPGDILTKVDRVSMANSLEARVPLLGRRVVEFAFSLSEEECYSKNNLKRILKNAYAEVIPEQILYGKKRGFGVPPKYFVAGRRNTSVTCELLGCNWKEI